jgi:hypothetical protein
MSDLNSLRSWIESLLEVETYALIRDLLVAMNFDRVAITHGDHEYGRDLVFRERDRIGREVWRGVQVKIDAPTGSLRSEKGLRSILTQCEAALETPYITSSGEVVILNEVWLLFTKPLTEVQKASAQGRMRSGKVQVIDGSHFADLIAEYMPELVRQRSGPLDTYFMSLFELSDQASPYLSTKLGAPISLNDLYVPPVAALALLRPSAISYLNPDRLRNHGLLDVKSIDEFVFLASVDILPALYHYQMFLAISRMLSLIDVASTFQHLHHADQDSIRAASDLAVALNIVLSMDSANYFYCGELKSEHLRAIAPELSKIDRPELSILRKRFEEDEPRLPARPKGRFIPEPRRSVSSDAERQGIMRQREELFGRIVHIYNTAIDPDPKKELIVVIPDVARLLFERTAARYPAKEVKERVEAIRKTVVNAQRAWNSYAERFCDSFSRRFASILGSIDQCINRLSTGTDVEQSDIATLAEARNLTDLADKCFDLPSGSIENREIDAARLCLHAPLLLIEGDLGSGKTTLLRRVAADSARNYDSRSKSAIPLFCSLARVSEDGDRDLSERLIEAAHQEIVKGMPSGATIRWFLDGFDEVRSTDLRRQIMSEIGLNALRGAVVLSSRPFYVNEKFPEALQVTLLPLRQEQVLSFVARFPWRDARSPGAMLEILGRESDLSELSKSPLLLTLMCILAQARGASQLPTRRASLYDLVVDLLLTDWDLAKGIQRERIIEDDSLRRVVLERSAYGLYERGQRYFSKEECVDLLISRYPLGPIPLDLGLMLFVDLVRDCIIVPAGQGQFGFLHYSVHEYLAALDIANDAGLERAFSALGEFANRGRWEEVLVFYAGIKRDVGPFLKSAHSHLGRSLGEFGSRRADLVRLIHRMLMAADFTRAERLPVKGAIAGIFAELAVGGLVDHWHQQEKLR